MKAQILLVNLDTEGRDDLVLITPQIVQTIRAALAPAAPKNGTIQIAGSQLIALPSTQAAAGEQVAAPGCDHLPGVTVRPPAETVDTTSRPSLTYYTTCQDCGEPKTKSTSPRCRRCAIKRGQLAARMEKATRHNDNGEN